MNVSFFFKTYLFTYKIPTLVGRPRTSEPLSPPPPEFKNGVVEMAPRLGKCAGQVLPTKLHPQSFCFSSWDRATLELKYSSLLSAGIKGVQHHCSALFLCCAYECYVCVYLCAPCACNAQRSSERVPNSPGLEYCGCKLLCGYWEPIPRWM